METQEYSEHLSRSSCCPCGPAAGGHDGGVSRRGFLAGLGGVALGGSVLTGLSWPALASGQTRLPTPAKRRPLTVKPILTYSTPTRRPQTSWRSWGGIQTQQDAEQEVGRIKGELEELRASADFPLEVLPVSAVRNKGEAEQVNDLKSADVILIYAAGGWMDMFEPLAAAGKPVIFFVRHRSGPVYLWYEIISSRYLRQHTDGLAVKGMDFQDVVVDSPEEIAWRLRALCGLKNSMATRIVAIGGPGGWSCPKAPELARERFELDIQTVSYDELGELIKAARKDQAAVALAARRAADYLNDAKLTLETKKSYVENAFLLEQIFRNIMARAKASAITVNHCMGTIMPLAETTACLTLTLLNDAGYLAFCESDFVVIPSGILLANISGRPVFLNDPTYAHDGVITLAHCTAPRKMDGKSLEPARILTHFESDYGAAPKVEMRKGQKVTMIIPDFAARHWVGLAGEIIDNPFLDICRAQIDVRFSVDSDRLNAATPGFHWMLGYGDYVREVGYALKKTAIEWECLA